MKKSFLGAGLSFPLAIDPRGRPLMTSAEEKIAQSIRIILGTARGERVMRPGFGCGIHDLVFASASTATHALIIHHVTEAITRWEPRVELTQVEISDADTREGQLLIGIQYRVISTNNEFNLVYPFYLQESGETS